MAITKEFVFEQYGALTPRVLDAWRNLGRLEGAQQVYSQLHLKLADDELQAEIEAANTAHAVPTTQRPPMSFDMEEGLADAIRASVTAAGHEPSETPDRGKPIVLQELDHPHQGDPGDEDDHAGSNDDPAAAFAPALHVDAGILPDPPHRPMAVGDRYVDR